MISIKLKKSLKRDISGYSELPEAIRGRCPSGGGYNWVEYMTIVIKHMTIVKEKMKILIKYMTIVIEYMKIVIEYMTI